MPTIIDRIRLTKSPALMTGTGPIFSHNSSGLDQEMKRTNGRSHSTAPPSTEQLRKLIKQLETMLMEEKEKRRAVEEHLFAYRERSIFKESEFRSIVDKLGNNLKKESPGVDLIYSQILQNFDQSNAYALEILQKKYEQNMQQMDRRCGQIVETTKIELSKVKKLSEDDFNRIKRDIEDILFLAKYIQEENTLYKTKISGLEFKNKVLTEERTFIIQQLIIKKRTVAKLMKERFASKDRMSAQRQKSLESRHTTQFEKRFDKIEIDNYLDSQKYIQTQKQSIVTTNKSFKAAAINYQKLTNPTISMTLMNDTSAPTTAKYRVPNQNSRATTKEGIRGEKILTNFSDFQTFSPNFNPKKNAYGNRQNPRRSLQRNPIPYDINSSCHDPIQQTVRHLRLCYERQRKKCLQLGTIVNRLQTQNKEINDTIQQCLKGASQSRINFQKKNAARMSSTSIPKNEGQNAVDLLVKSEKLFQVIRDIKKRLGMLQGPALNCGWGDQDMKILDQLEKDTDYQATHMIEQIEKKNLQYLPQEIIIE